MASACNALLADAEFEAALSNSLRHFLYIFGLKHEQKLCLETVAKKGDVFGILTTGFWKNLELASVVVVMPLVSIIKDQS